MGRGKRAGHSSAFGLGGLVARDATHGANA